MEVKLPLTKELSLHETTKIAFLANDFIIQAKNIKLLLLFVEFFNKVLIKTVNKGLQIRL